jgi:hypothetical protein
MSRVNDTKKLLIRGALVVICLCAIGADVLWFSSDRAAFATVICGVLVLLLAKRGARLGMFRTASLVPQISATWDRRKILRGVVCFPIAFGFGVAVMVGIRFGLIPNTSTAIFLLILLPVLGILGWGLYLIFGGIYARND